jgi:hypothetical protein
MVINPSCTQIITSHMACKPRIITLGQPHWFCKIFFFFFEIRTCDSNLKFLKQNYRSLARVWRKLGSKTLTLELRVLACHLIEKYSSFNRVVLGSYKSLQYLLKGRNGIQTLPNWLHLVVFLPGML